ncbi:MAG: DUF2062 domain-containing protein [Nitrospirales bacterium]|nr:MAG: DUF2062 domain-containing protein [Nitrospirales bacterium]
MLSVESLRQRLTQVLHLQETPHRTALAFATGVFIAFAPHYLFHTASAVFCAWMFRLNYVAIFLGSFINNPWTLIPILAASLYTGVFLMGVATHPTIEWSELTMDNLFDMLAPYLVPFLVGACTLSVLASLIAYPLMRWTITRYRNMTHHPSSEPHR